MIEVELLYFFSHSLVIYEDCDRSCSFLKHIDVRYHKIRQLVVEDKVIDLVKISTKKI